MLSQNLSSSLTRKRGDYGWVLKKWGLELP